MMIPKTAFDEILSALEYEDMELDEREQLMLDLSDLAFRSSIMKLMERMEPATREEFVALIEKDPAGSDIEAFIEAWVPDAESAVQEAVREITDDILAVTKK